jgi:hypothetical protein
VRKALSVTRNTVSLVFRVVLATLLTFPLPALQLSVWDSAGKRWTRRGCSPTTPSGLYHARNILLAKITWLYNQRLSLFSSGCLFASAFMTLRRTAV